ncbi:uncharacterized protein Triagg1_5213 [Trichoderma aggressivum f. europaeum]|uniref:F-box domain-containing protein n=1 Tax=Trichoderma aggressivum f. europaeum TaxID=173218 RepID=A0AAE1LZH2_9HYPO|nr:hypothetical protein Triagg1_5213 [Trichoderma aggressivum f. europaeum]
MASDSRKSQRSLMDMPNEILLEICENLCSHCSDIPTTFQKDLSNLSMTSKRLRAVALPVLYHDASPRNTSLFLRTITSAEHKHLAAQVHRFCNSGDDCSWSDELDHILIRHQLLGEVLAELTNAKQLDINVPCGSDARLDGLPKMPVPMESVTTLSLTPWADVDLGQMSDFLAAMPCLETLKVKDCMLVTQRLPLARIRSLTFHLGLIGPKSLQNLVDSCPILEHLDLYLTDFVGAMAQYEPAPLTWSSAQSTLQSRRETLKHLRLRLGLDPYDWDQVSPEEYYGSFRGFDSLESLWVLTAGFGSVDDQGTPSFPENVQQLVTMLPGSLTCIYFQGFHEKWNKIHVMAQAIREGHFPRLKRVVVEDYSSPIDTDTLQHCERLSNRPGVRFEYLSYMEMYTRWKQCSTPAYAKKVNNGIEFPRG